MEVIRSIREFEALRGEWNRLADGHENPLLWHEWFLSCARTLHAEQDLFVVVDLTDGRLRAAAPLVVRRARSVSRLEFLGVARLYEPCGFLYETEDAVERLIRRVSSEGYPFSLDRVSAGDANFGVLTRALRRRCLVVRRQARGSLAIPLRGNGQAFLSSLSPRLRYDLSRARRRAELIGEVRVDIISAAPADVASLLEEFVRLEGSGWKGRSGSALQHRDSLRSFFFEVARATAARGALRVSRLWVGGDLAAAQLAIAAYSRLWVLKIAFDERLARCSPGLILTGEAVKDAVDQGFVAYEFLGVAEAWERRWRTVVRPYSAALVYPKSPSGAWALAADVGRGAWRRMQQTARLMSGGRSRPVT
jgi:CelD/BcsL family acetyltransferase involved in cellulose biosynthesis